MLPLPLLLLELPLLELPPQRDSHSRMTGVSDMR